MQCISHARGTRTIKLAPSCYTLCTDAHIIGAHNGSANSIYMPACVYLVHLLYVCSLCSVHLLYVYSLCSVHLLHIYAYALYMCSISMPYTCAQYLCSIHLLYMYPIYTLYAAYMCIIYRPSVRQGGPGQKFFALPPSRRIPLLP